MTACDVSSRSLPRAVSFSEYSELIVYVPDSDKSSRCWYSAADRKCFRYALINEARRVSQEIKCLAPGEAMSLELLCDCLGIENFLGAEKHTKQNRRAHITAVLMEQLQQNQNGTCDIERLSQVSEVRSEWSKTRAWMLATHYVAVQMD